MKIKVCGMTQARQILALENIAVTGIGLNFYPSSPRYISTDAEILEIIDHVQLEKIGVFVNVDLNVLQNTVTKFKLNYIQLHGNENLEYLHAASKICPVIKVIKITHQDFSWNEINPSMALRSHYFLLDTYTKIHGGSGQTFDWEILNTYPFQIPFYLSGGISIEHSNKIRKIDHPQFAGIDINSRFETTPGIKNLALIHQFTTQLYAK